MKYFRLLIIILNSLCISVNYAYSLTADDYLNNSEVNDYLLEIVQESCVKNGILNCRKVAISDFSDIDKEEDAISRYRLIKFAWFYSFGYYYYIDNAIKLKKEKKFQILPVEREEYKEAENLCNLLIDKMELNNKDEKINIILKTRTLYIEYVKREVENQRKIKAIEDSLNGIRQRLKAKKLTKQDDNDIINTIPKDFAKYDYKMKTDKLDKYEYKIYKLLRDFMSLFYDLE